HRTGEGLVPADRGSRPLLELDEALRHDAGAGCGDPVPGLGRGLLHHRRYAARGRRLPRLNDGGWKAFELTPHRREREMSDEQNTHTAGFAERVRANQQKLTAELKPHYDFIVCGSGSSGSVVARRLAEDAEVSVLLLEAGGSDDMPSIMEAGQWPLNLGSERDWAFVGQPNPHLKGRSLPLNMGKVLGGGSSINLMAWARGHRNDWDFFAAEARDAAWGYES